MACAVVSCRVPCRVVPCRAVPCRVLSPRGGSHPPRRTPHPRDRRPAVTQPAARGPGQCPKAAPLPPSATSLPPLCRPSAAPPPPPAPRHRSRAVRCFVFLRGQPGAQGAVRCLEGTGSRRFLRPGTGTGPPSAGFALPAVREGLWLWLGRCQGWEGAIRDRRKGPVCLSPAAHGAPAPTARDFLRPNDFALLALCNHGEGERAAKPLPLCNITTC